MPGIVNEDIHRPDLGDWMLGHRLPAGIEVGNIDRKRVEIIVAFICFTQLSAFALPGEYVTTTR